MRGRPRLLTLVATPLVLIATIACEPTLQQETGIVIDVDSPALGRVDGFELATLEGQTLDFDTTELEFRSEFPPSHLAEHRLLADHITVTYKLDDGRLVVTQLDDASL